MKPTSIIFIIVSVVLIIAGVVTMSFARQSDPNILSTEAGNVMPYPEDGGTYREIYRINIDVKDADVIINGVRINSGVMTEAQTSKSESENEDVQAEETAPAEGTISSNVKVENTARVKLTNFTEGLYECQYANRVLSIRDNYDMGSVSGVFSFIKNFKGFRHYLNYHAASKLEKTIEIDISGDVSINCLVLNGEITINCIRSSEDCTVKLMNGNVTVKDSSVVRDEYTGFPKRGALNVAVDKGNIAVNNSGFAKYNLILGTQIQSETDGVEAPPYSTREEKRIDGGLEIGEYYVTAAAGTIVVKERYPLSCRLEIEYGAEGNGIYSAAPNAAGTRYNITADSIDRIIVTLEQQSEADVPSTVSEYEDEVSQSAA